MSDLPPAMGDVVTVREVLLNLLDNAIKFTQHRETAIIRLTGVATESEVRYVVRDNGAGFDMARRNKLFGVFQRLHSREEFEGTGIGLALVQRIIQRHHGQVGAEGKAGEGASFWFTLPQPGDLIALAEEKTVTAA
jgi:light-regulated signal transduction histidine kinase (bacteriophytochrome)